MTRILGAVLAGGRSSRFGSDKAAALLRARPLADHAAAAIAPYVDAIVRIGGDGGIADRPRSGLGPLGGLAGALAHADANGFAVVLSTACDMPRVDAPLIAALLRRTPSYCADAPVLGAWPVTALTDALALLEQNGPSGDPGRDAASSPIKDGPSLRAFARSLGAIPVAASTPLPNVNTPEDLLAL